MKSGIPKNQTYTYNLQPLKFPNLQLLVTSCLSFQAGNDLRAPAVRPLRRPGICRGGGLAVAHNPLSRSRGGGIHHKIFEEKCWTSHAFGKTSPEFCLRHEKIIFKLEWFIVISCILSDTLLCFWMVYWVLLCAQSKSQSAVGHVLPNIFRGFCNYEAVWPFVVYKPLRGRQPWRPQEMIAVSRVAMEDTWCVFLAPNVKLLAFWHTAWGKRMSWAGTVQDPKLPVGVKWTTWPEVKIYEHITIYNIFNM